MDSPDFRPLPVVGMVGAGQLARMTHQAAIALGQSLRVLAERPTTRPHWCVPTCAPGLPPTWRALREFAHGVRGGHLRPRAGAAGEPARARRRGRRRRTRARTRSLHAQDKLVMRRRLGGARGRRAAVRGGHARPATSSVRRRARLAGGAEGRTRRLRRARRVDARRPGAGAGGRAARRGHAADGRGGACRCAASWPRWSRARRSGRRAAWPVVETVQEDGSACRCSPRRRASPRTWPRRRSSSPCASPTELGVDGPAGRRAVRDAPTASWSSTSWRCGPHNSGHWTIEGSRTSQFEQHLRAVLDYPLGATAPDRAGGGDGQRAGRRTAARDDAWTSGCTTSSRGSRT